MESDREGKVSDVHWHLVPCEIAVNQTLCCDYKSEAVSSWVDSERHLEGFLSQGMANYSLYYVFLGSPSIMKDFIYNIGMHISILWLEAWGVKAKKKKKEEREKRHQSMLQIV